MVVRPQSVRPGDSWVFCLSFALQLNLILQVPVGSLLTYGSHPSRWGHPCGIEAIVLDRNEGLVCFPFPFGLFLHVVPALRDEVTIWVSCWLGAPAAGRGCCALSPYGWASNLCLRLLFAPCPTGVFPGGPRYGRESSVVLSSLQCSSLSHVMVTCSPPRPLLRV